MRRSSLASACALILLSVSALKAQQGPREEASPAQSGAVTSPSHCELHIWPASTTHTTFQGWLKAGAVDGARRGIKGYPDMRADAIDTAQQATVLKSIDWRGIAADPNLDVVVHDTPVAEGDDRARTTRLMRESPACYSELIITTSMVEAAAFSTRSVRILALRKTFNGDAPPLNFSSMAKAVIELPEQVKPGDPRIDEATRKAFASAIYKFAVMQSFH